MFDLFGPRGLAVAHEGDATAEPCGILARRGSQDLVIADARQRTCRSVGIQQPRPIAGIERAEGTDRLGRPGILDRRSCLRCDGPQPVGDRGISMRELADQECGRLELPLRFELLTGLRQQARVLAGMPRQEIAQERVSLDGKCLERHRRQRRRDEPFFLEGHEPVEAAVRLREQRKRRGTERRIGNRRAQVRELLVAVALFDFLGDHDAARRDGTRKRFVLPGMQVASSPGQWRALAEQDVEHDQPCAGSDSRSRSRACTQRGQREGISGRLTCVAGFAPTRRSSHR